MKKMEIRTCQRGPGGDWLPVGRSKNTYLVTPISQTGGNIGGVYSHATNIRGEAGGDKSQAH